MLQDAYVVGQCSRIQDVLQYAANKSVDDPELGAHLANYISVLISGVVEDCVEHLVVQRARMSSDLQLQDFVDFSIGRLFRNPQSSDIAEILRQFSPDYRVSYQQSVNGEDREALDGIIKNRMSLAHEGSSQSHFTLNDVRRYFERVVRILEVVEGILIPGSQPQISQPEAVNPC